MRVLFLESSPVWIYGLPNGFKDAGAEVKISGPLTKDNILPLVAGFAPDLAILIGWTDENCRVETQEWISKCIHEAGVPLIYWATEDAIHTMTWSLPFIQRVKPDFVFSISRETVDTYHKLGIPAAYMDFGYHPGVNRPALDDRLRGKFLAVVANAYPDLMEAMPSIYRLEAMRILLSPLLKNNIRIDFWGCGWEKMQPFLGHPIPPAWRHGYLYYPETSKVYSAATITIGLQNHPRQVTQRVYEILASGGFLLTTDTPEIRRLFKPGHDLAVSSSPAETRDVVSYYLENPDECARIRSQGQSAVRPHSYKHRAEYMIDVLRAHNLVSCH